MLFITGFHASGKTVAAEQLAADYNLLYVETSALVKSAHQLDRPDLSIGAWARLMEYNYGSSVFDDLIADYAIVAAIEAHERRKPYADVLISGNRSYDGITHIGSRFEEYNDIIPTQREIIHVNVPIELQYERFRVRNRESGDSTMPYEQFLSDVIGSERESGLEEIIKHATRYIENDGDLTDFRHEVDRTARDLRLTRREYTYDRIPRV